MSPILTTDEEVLALAAKIKHRRALDVKRRAASEQLAQLEDDLSTGTTKLRDAVRVSFYTIGSSFRANDQDAVELYLPVGDGPDIIEFLSEFLANNISEKP